MASGTGISLTSTIALLSLLATGRYFYRLGKLRVEVGVRFLLKGVLGDRVECLLNIDRFFGGSFEIRNVVLALAPLLGPLLGDLKSRWN